MEEIREEEKRRSDNRLIELLTDKIQDLEYHIKSLEEQINFKDDLLDKYYEMFKQINEQSKNISKMIVEEFIDLGEF